jgi:hypothetical protein
VKENSGYLTIFHFVEMNVSKKLFIYLFIYLLDRNVLKWPPRYYGIIAKKKQPTNLLVISFLLFFLYHETKATLFLRFIIQARQPGQVDSPGCFVSKRGRRSKSHLTPTRGLL